MDILFLLIGFALGMPVAYLYVLALASLRARVTLPRAQPRYRFAIAIPAHDEETVIARTVETLRQMDYPRDQFDIFVGADFCNDRTAARARAAGAICWERDEGTRGGKGNALAWLFQRIFAHAQAYEASPQGAAEWDAVVVFDADTIADAAFLRVMDARLQRGAQVVQGCHRIVNPQDAWFAALTWAMFIVDNRFQNLGRANLGWSAKNMGDAICFRADILRALGWGEGLTEDYEFRQRLLLNGIRIQYEPAAIGYGEAPTSWQAARAQRARWLSGTFRASRRYAWEMLRAGWKRKDAALLDGAAQALLPSYSTLTVFAVAGLLIQAVLSNGILSVAMGWWLGLLLLLGLYPLLGLMLERAPARAYIAIGLGPVFIVWRTIVGISARFGRRPVVWVRTARRDSVERAEANK